MASFLSFAFSKLKNIAISFTLEYPDSNNESAFIVGTARRMSLKNWLAIAKATKARLRESRRVSECRVYLKITLLIF